MGVGGAWSATSADKMLPSPRRRRRRRGWATATRPRHVVRSSAEVVTHQVCAQGARSGVSARGRATAGVGSETAKRWARKHDRRPPLFRRGHRSNAAASDSVLAPAGRRRRRRCRLKKANGAPRHMPSSLGLQLLPPSRNPLGQAAGFASGGRRRTWAACGCRYWSAATIFGAILPLAP